MIGTAVIGDHKHICEFLRGITDRDPVKPRCEIDSVPVRLAAETMEPSSIKLHAWVPVIVKWQTAIPDRFTWMPADSAACLAVTDPLTASKTFSVFIIS